MRRRLLVGLVVAVLGGTWSLPGTAHAATSSPEVAYRKITFPVQGPVSYGNTWGAARDGGARQHQGTDVMGHKLEVLLAAHDGTVSWTRTDGNNMLAIRDSEGWEYWYIHINNDSPGTDDGANKPELMFFPGIARGVKVTAGQPIAYMGDSGNAEGTAPHLHFELHTPAGAVVNSWYSLMLAQGRRVNDRCGFDENPVLVASAAKTRGGYWAVSDDGGVYSYGGAPFHGSMSGRRLNAPVISMTPTRGGGGYWELSADGGIFSFGDARFHGSTGAMRLNQPVVGMAATASGDGYWLVARDGGIFSFGDARFLGSTGGATATPVVDLAVSPSGTGYWMLTEGGAVLPFGEARDSGAVDRVGFCTPPPAVALAPTGTGNGYWVQTADGNTFPFGDAPDQGSPKRSGVTRRPVVAIAALP